MAEVKGMTLSDKTMTDAAGFFDQAADKDLLRFLRSLPVVGANNDAPFTIEDLTYVALLQPYVLHAWKKIAGKPDLPGRIHQLTQVYKAAETALERETGRKRRVPRVINLTAFMDAYTSRGLPL